MSLIHNMPAEDYHALPGLNSSRLKIMASKTPMHANADREREETLSLRLGTAVHAATLEPVEFERRFFIAPQERPDMRTKAGKDLAAVNVQIATNLGASLLWYDEGEEVRQMRGQIWSHPRASEILSGALSEVVATWQDGETGQDCKARFDVIRPTGGAPELRTAFLADIKTTAKGAGPREFARVVADYYYHLQAAHYVTGAEANGLRIDGFIFIAIETAPPYAVATYLMTEEALRIGRTVCSRAIRRWDECEAANHWPGYSEDLEPLTLPAWAQEAV
jgi:exodeoxyribonuclease VIII